MHVVIIFDHPYGVDAGQDVPHHRSFSAALLAATLQGLGESADSVDVIDLHGDAFNPVMTRDDLVALRLEQTSDPRILDYRRRLSLANHLVFIYPTWWMAMPAGTKGFLDRTLGPGFAYDEPKPGGVLKGRLHQLSGVTVLTPMTTPRWAYLPVFGAPGSRILLRGTFRLLGIRNLKFVAFAGPAGRTLLQRKRMLESTRRRFARLRAPRRTGAVEFPQSGIPPVSGRAADVTSPYTEMREPADAAEHTRRQRPGG